MSLNRTTIAALAIGSVAVLGGSGAAAYALGSSNHSTTVAAATATPSSTPSPAAKAKVPAKAPKKIVVVAPKPAKTVYVQPAAAVQPQFTNSLAVVAQYYQDITDQNYQAAWNLGGSNLSGGAGYSSWVAGYSTTASISLDGQASWDSGAVLTDIAALQSDGSVRTYSGTYYVSGGVITSASIAQTSGGSYAPAAAAPSGLSYAGQGTYGPVYANSVTSASFAVSVANAYAGGGGSDYETVYSSATGQSYAMSYVNVGNLTIQATGGNDVLVQFAVSG